MPSLVLEIPAAIDPVSLTDMKTFLRLETTGPGAFTDDDTLITGLISAATITCEGFCRRSFINKGFRQSLDSFPYFTDTIMSQMAYPPAYYSLPRYSTTLWNYSQMIKLFRPPLVSVDRITWLSDADKQFHDMIPVPSLWYPGTAYTLGTLVMDNNGNQQKCITAGTSDSQPPTWAASVPNVTTEVNPDPGGEGTIGVQWQNKGPLNSAQEPPTGSLGGDGTNAGTTQFGAFLMDNSQEPGRVFPGPPGFYWPSVLYVPNAVQIHFTAGYGTTAASVPANIVVAIKQLVADCYENREPMPNSTETLPRHVRMLLWPSVVLDLAPTRG
jgi:hypothetical protein